MKKIIIFYKNYGIIFAVMVDKRTLNDIFELTFSWYFSYSDTSKGVSPENTEAVELVMRDFVQRRSSLVGRYEKYRELRKKLPENRAAAEKARAEYFKTLSELRVKQ